jgi:hypothetical protein
MYGNGRIGEKIDFTHQFAQTTSGRMLLLQSIIQQRCSLVGERNHVPYVFGFGTQIFLSFRAMIAKHHQGQQRLLRVSCSVPAWRSTSLA